MFTLEESALLSRMLRVLGWAFVIVAISLCCGGWLHSRGTSVRLILRTAYRGFVR